MNKSFPSIIISSSSFLSFSSEETGDVSQYDIWLPSRLYCSFSMILILVDNHRHVCQTFIFMDCCRLISIVYMICLCFIINLCTWQCLHIHTQSLKLIFTIHLLFVNSERDGREKLVEYIDWFTRKTSKLVNNFAATKDILLKYDYMFKDLNALLDDKFTSMNINENIANQIKSYIEKFLSAKAMGCIEDV